MRDYGNDRKGNHWWPFLGCVLIGAFAVAVLIGIYRMNPEPDVGRPALYGCGFKLMTGLECPGCGATRATHYLMRGEVDRAFRMNPAFVGGLPVLLAGIPVLLAARRQGKRVSAAMVWWIGVTLLVLVVAYWVVRNQEWWPWPLP